MKMTKKIQKAIDLASRLHLGQTRKGDPGLPYISHPFSVAWVLAEYSDNEDIIIAGLLHDVLEDVKGYGYRDLKNDFGEKVARIVRGVSEDKDPNVSSDEKATWVERKLKYLQNLKKKSRSALLVSAADKIHNLRSMVAAYQLQGEALWERFNAPADKRLWFYEEMVKALSGQIDKRMLAGLEHEIWRLKKMVELGTSKLLIGLVPDADDNVAVYLINNSDKH
jgi:(p)ppGpp synthase/HD superfamily hydrolase